MIVLLSAYCSVSHLWMDKIRIRKKNIMQLRFILYSIVCIGVCVCASLLCFHFHLLHAENALGWNNFCVQRKRLCILNEFKMNIGEQQQWQTAQMTAYTYEYIIILYRYARYWKKVSSHFIWKKTIQRPAFMRNRDRITIRVFFST